VVARTAVEAVRSGQSILAPSRSASYEPVTTSNPRLLDSYGKLPLSFEANQGQSDGRVKFLSRGSGYTVFLTDREAVLAFRRSSRDTAVLRLKLVGARTAINVSGLEELPGKSNYFIGNDGANWHTNVPTYAKVRYQQAYPGIDLFYYGHQTQLEYDFVVAPGANPRAIQLRMDGAQKMRIDANGDLVLQAGEHAVQQAGEGPEQQAGDAEVRFHKPSVYQQAASESPRQVVEGRYVLKGAHEVGFEVAAYDMTKPLIIDPVLTYSTYIIGASGYDGPYGIGIAADRAGNAYLTGVTLSTNFPTANALQPTLDGRSDAFVAKLNPAGSMLLYSTYLGGSGDEYGYGIAVDSGGNTYVTGRTGSTNFPTANAVQPNYSGGLTDAFVAAISPTGSTLLYSTFLGGSDNDEGHGIAVDSAGNAYVTGWTRSMDFTTASALQTTYNGGIDAFVAKFSPTGSTLLYSTYLGGGGLDIATGVAVDGAGKAYVTGYTRSTDFPTVNALQPTNNGGQWATRYPWSNTNPFVAAVDPTGQTLIYSTYLGSSGWDEAFAIAVDSAGNACITGVTYSFDFPTTANALQPTTIGSLDAFVAKLDPTGSTLLYSTYLGGGSDDEAHGIAVDSAGNVYVTGWTWSADFPTANPVQPSKRGDYDAFVAKLNPTGSTLLFSTYLGGSAWDEAFAIAVDGARNTYVTGWTLSTDFPLANPLQPSPASAFVSKIGQ
jgi:hypothetical protein